MRTMRLLIVLGLMAAAALFIGRVQTVNAQEVDQRQQAVQQMKNGNWKEAYTTFSTLALNPKSDPARVSDDLISAIQCLQRLGRTNEIDDLREGVIAAQPQNWRLLQAAAQSYLNGEHYGFMVAGTFERGNHRGGGKYVQSYDRDRVRALQLLQDALPLIAKEPQAQAAASFYWSLAETLQYYNGDSAAWRLQILTDIFTLPDYEENRYYNYGGGRGAPVDGAGNPVYYHIPASWEQAANDGERWRWAMARAAALNHDGYADQADFTFASFLHGQFGVQTMAYYGRYMQADDDKVNESGPYAVQTLKDTETIARLANGTKRFTLPDEFNAIKIFQRLANGKRYRAESLSTLAQIYEDRRQYPTAADYWRQCGNTQRVKQITGNWGTFESVTSQPAGQAATADFRFRNGKLLHLKASPVNVEKLLADVQAYLKTNPNQLQWDQVNLNNIGYRLVTQNQAQYVGEPVAMWDLPLTPRANHFDKRITITTPLKKAGAYLLTATLENGNTSRIVLWVADTVIVKKQLDQSIFYYVADAVTGKPIPNAQLDFFGYHQDWKNADGGRGRYDITTKAFSITTDPSGKATTSNGNQETNYTWVTTATSGNRLAYLGFTGAWYGQIAEAEYNATRTFAITDRPVYRPEQTVHFKLWINQSKYDIEGKSPYAGQNFSVRITNPKGEKVYEKALIADEFGGVQGDLELPKGAALGQYSISDQRYGGGSFRVEEYKKPEFEVTVDAPSEPVMLGEKITATVNARYLFGAPVTNAKVSYKVMRTAYSASWYPAGRWDWLYGSGYWWYAYNYSWYPGWRDWGCVAPYRSWWGYRPQPQPEMVMEGEAQIGEDGTFKVTIDTSFAKAMQGDTDHRYQITAEVTDRSRRTIVGQGQVLVARKPFKVYAWVNKGYFRTGEPIKADFNAQTLDGRGVKGEGELKLLRIRYKKDGAGELVPDETVVQRWDLDTNAQGRASLQLKASQAGQYRLCYSTRDNQAHEIEGGYVFVVRGEGFDGSNYRFNELELVTDQQQYAPGDTVNLMVNTNRDDATVLLFTRPANGVYRAPKLLAMNGKSALETIAVEKRDMPNFFVEALTVYNGQVYTEVREVVVPPEQRVLNVRVEPNKQSYKPGEKATVKLTLTDADGKPFRGSTVVSMYDKAVEYISGGSNVPEIRSFYWNWRRSHNPRTEHSLARWEGNTLRQNEEGFSTLGIFGAMELDEEREDGDGYAHGGVRTEPTMRAMKSAAPAPSMAFHALRPSGEMAMDAMSVNEEGAMANRLESKDKSEVVAGGAGGAAGGAEMVEPSVRSNFADTAFWAGAVTTDANGQATIDVTMPENLTTWKTRVWAMGAGTRVGEGTAEVVTTKNLIIRLQAPRFFVQKDEVVLSANVHNYLQTGKSVKAVLEIVEADGAAVSPLGAKIERVKANEWAWAQTVTVKANGEERVDWRVKIDQPGMVTVRMKALTDEESDAMEMTFPIYVHGMLKTDSLSGVIRPEGKDYTVNFRVPTERRPEQSRLEIRYSPTLAGAMVDALPYMVEYPYENTEVTLNRFLPSVITQQTLLRMGVDLKAIQAKRTNLNAQEIGDDLVRAKDWRRQLMPGQDGDARNPVFDQAEVNKMVDYNIGRLQSMQCSDGGWGWFSGWGEQSWPHTTAMVVHGLQIAKANNVNVPDDMLLRGVQWLQRYQAEELRRLKLPENSPYWKRYADNLDAMVYMVLVDAKSDNTEMRDFLYRDRTQLAVYAKAMFALALHDVKDIEKRDMLVRNIDQFVVIDNENQTAYLKMPENSYWWAWYGSDIEANAYYLKLLTRVAPKDERASGLVKYLLNNRKHATYWNSTRDTAIAVEAFADYLAATNELKPNMTVNVMLDDKLVKTVRIDATNLFTYDNKYVLEGPAVTDGNHKLTITKEGTGPLYFNAYLTNFTMEDPITKAGLEIKVNRKYFKLTRKPAAVHVEGAHGQAVAQAVEKYERTELKDLATLKSGDLVEVELEIDSKNDYEYLMFEDMKAAGFEPVEVRSGYGDNEMGAYMELRDERVCFFVRQLARGKHSISYRLRAEIPGTFSILPSKASAVYAPELRANSDELKLSIED